MKSFRTSLFNLFKSEHAQSVSLDKVRGQISKDYGDQYSEDEIFEAINKMMEANQVMLADDVVFLIWFKCCWEQDDQIVYRLDLHCATQCLTLHVEYLNSSSYFSELSDKKTMISTVCKCDYKYKLKMHYLVSTKSEHWIGLQNLAVKNECLV